MSYNHPAMIGPRQLAMPESDARLANCTPCSLLDTRPETKLLAVGRTNEAPMASAIDDPTTSVAVKRFEMPARGRSRIPALTNK